MGMDQLQSAFANRTEAAAPWSFETRNTLGGVVSALTQLPEWAGVLALDELEQRIVFRLAAPAPLRPAARPPVTLPCLRLFSPF
jgi:hypothetical protein